VLQVVLPTNEITPITNYCSAIKSIKNMETQSIGIKSLLGTCDVKVWDNYNFIFRQTNIDSFQIFQAYLVNQ
jgi:hypothetical protein